MKRKLFCLGALLLAAQVAHATPTGQRGQGYVDECRAAGVPKPPPWPSTKWIFNGALDRPLNPHDPTSAKTFISPTLVAEVYYYDSSVDFPAEPRGICFGLPRFNMNPDGTAGNTISLFGIICQGKATGNACFWDNKNPNLGSNFPIGRTQMTPIVGAPGASFAGGLDLAEKTTEECTSCHAGENAFIIHPADLGANPADKTRLALDPALLSVDTGWYNPLVADSWPMNPGPGNQLDGIALDFVAGDRSCTSCHKFPQLSKELDGYCGDEFPNAIALTMPAYQDPAQTFVPAVNNPAYAKHIQALRDACNQPAPAEFMMMMD